MTISSAKSIRIKVKDPDRSPSSRPLAIRIDVALQRSNSLKPCAFVPVSMDALGDGSSVCHCLHHGRSMKAPSSHYQSPSGIPIDHDLRHDGRRHHADRHYRDDHPRHDDRDGRRHHDGHHHHDRHDHLDL